MTDLSEPQRQDLGAPKPTAIDPQTEALLTRRRWDLYFLPATLVAAVLGACVAVTTGEMWTLIVPVQVALIWLFTRCSTPPEGMRARQMSADPEFVWLICWQVLMLVLLLASMAADCYVNGRSFGAPLEAYQAVYLGPIMTAFVVGTVIFGRRVNRRRESEKKTRTPARAD
jgi:hypothetical protein